MRLTESQRVAVEHRGSDLLVAASAGSGKTEVLTERCLSLIADPERPCGVEQLLVVTFTRAAAAELRARLRRKLREAEAAASPALRRHLRRQALLVEVADIGTIDAWCGRLVREHYAEAGVDPAFTILGEQDAALLRREVMDALFDNLHRGEDPLADEFRDWLARLPAPDDRPLRQLVARLNAFREHLVNPEQWFAQQIVECERDDTRRIVGAAIATECRFQLAQLDELRRRTGVTDSAPLARYAATLEAWARLVAQPDGLETFAEQVKSYRFSERGERIAQAEVVEEVKGRWFEKRLKERWAPEKVATILAAAPLAPRRIRTLLTLEARYDELLRAAKRARSVCEFADVLRLTLDLLGTATKGPQRIPTGIAQRLQERYEHILVDEYQDTSPVQVEIVRLVSRAAAGRGNRFMVGDLKQSIYAFRRAEPRLFAELIQAYEAGRGGGCVRYLSDNFRSHPQVLEPLNRMFALLFDRVLGGTDFTAQEQLRAARAEVDNPSLAGRPRVAVHIVELPAKRETVFNGEDDEVGVERIEREAQLAAKHIQALLEDGVQVPERGPDGQPALRPLRLGDVVVLLRAARGNAGHVARVLRNNGIRCAAVGREALLESVEVNDVRNVLQLLVNRRQDVALAAYLRGPIGGLTPRELLQIRQAGAQGDFFNAVVSYVRKNASTDLGQRLAAALRRLDEWALAAQETEVPVLVERIIRESGLATFAHGLPGGEQRVTLLRALQNLAQTFGGGGQGVAEFVEYLDTLAEEEIDPGVLAVPDADVVRIMTIHAAKGLEFPVVFLLGAGNRFNTESLRQSVLCDERHGLGVRYNDYPARTPVLNAQYLLLQQHIRQRELEEELRLLYVATTRARELLVVIGSAGEGCWEKTRARWSAGGDFLPLIARQSVASRLEWVLMAIAAGRLHEASAGKPPLVEVQTHAAAEIQVPRFPSAVESTSEAKPVAMSGDDAAWVQRTCFLLATPPDYARAALPAALSVSALKELALHDTEADIAETVDPFLRYLRSPQVGDQQATPDGAVLGRACHRFLQFADLTWLGTTDDVRGQLAVLVGARRLAEQEAALVAPDDVVWLATQVLSPLLRRSVGPVHREVPFVYALPIADVNEHTIVRGVIDCLIETPEGLIVLDYKTDLPARTGATGGRRDEVAHDTSDLDLRLRAYRVQLQLYATAAGSIFGQPVVRAVLVFLRARQVVEVPATPPEPATLLDLLAGRLRPTPATPMDRDRRMTARVGGPEEAP